MIAFYRDWEDVQREKFDGFIVTGAPIELLDFEDVTYWDELQRIFDWTQTNVHSTFNICWGAQAGLHHFHGVPKHTLPKKALRRLSATRTWHPPRPICAASRTISRFPCRAGRRVRRADMPEGQGPRQS